MVKKVVIGVGAALVLVYVLLLVVPIDPVERRPGTRLGGDLAADQTPEWADRGRKQIAVQTRTWYAVPHAVTTTSWIDGGSFYVPCARCAGKRWPSNVARDKPGATEDRRPALRPSRDPHHGPRGTRPCPRYGWSRSGKPHRRVPHGSDIARSRRRPAK